jgi:hypothetical protein
LIENIWERGSTNLHGGLQKALEIIRDMQDRSRLCKVFLFSDGMANAGVTHHEAIFSVAKNIARELNAQVASFGVGSHYDEPLMRGIAEYGASDYFFISGPASIMHVVNIATKGFTNTMGKYAKIEFTDGVTVKKIYGQTGTVINIGEIRYNATKQILVELDIPKNQQVLHYVLRYNAAATNEAKAIAKNITLQYSGDKAQLERKNEEAHVFHQIQLINEKEAEVTELLQQNKVKEAIKAKRKLHSEAQAIPTTTTTSAQMIFSVSARMQKTLYAMESMTEPQPTIATTAAVNGMAMPTTASVPDGSSLSKMNAFYQTLNEVIASDHDEL